MLASKVTLRYRDGRYQTTRSHQVAALIAPTQLVPRSANAVPYFRDESSARRTTGMLNEAAVTPHIVLRLSGGYAYDRLKNHIYYYVYLRRRYYYYV